MALEGRIVLITGGSRGLGLALAKEFAAAGAKVAICARNVEQLAEAERQLRAGGGDVLAVPCDVTDAADVRRMVDHVVHRWDGIDVLVPNAGTITVGPLEAQTDTDFANALDTMFWGVYHPTMAALPHLERSSSPRITVITSIGGKVPAPHLLPYTVAKHAAVGFSEGLRVELAHRDIPVTTVVPGLMRTGSYQHALTKGDHAAEYRWFGLLDSLPFTSTSAEHAARRIVAATRRGDAQIILTWQAQLAVRAHGLAPALSTRLASVTEPLLPDAEGTPEEQEPQLGKEAGSIGPADVLGERAAQRLQHKDE